MAKTTINNGDSGATVRAALNAMFTELYSASLTLPFSGTASSALTTSQSLFSIGGTWNNSGVTFPGALLVDVTNTASASGSLLADFRVGGITKAKVDKAGLVTATNFISAATITLTDAATIAWDVNNGPVASVTLGATGRTLTPSNMVSGQTYILFVKQDATGSRTITTWTSVKWLGGVAPTLSTAANAVDIISGVSDGTYLYASATLGYV